MKKLFVLFLLVSITGSVLNAQDVNWYAWEKGYEKAKDEDKIMLVFMHAKWCDMCKRMLDKTFTNETTVSMINKDFIAVKYDLDDSQKFKYNGKEYEGKQFAMKLSGSGQLGIPAIAFVDAKANKNVLEGGLKNHEEMQALLKKYKDKL